MVVYTLKGTIYQENVSEQWVSGSFAILSLDP